MYINFYPDYKYPVSSVSQRFLNDNEIDRYEMIIQLKNTDFDDVVTMFEENGIATTLSCITLFNDMNHEITHFTKYNYLTSLAQDFNDFYNQGVININLRVVTNEEYLQEPIETEEELEQ